MTALLLTVCLLATSIHEESRFLMGTIAVVRAGAPDDATAAAAVDTAFAELTRLDAIFSTWRPDSEISRLGAAEPGTWTPVSPELVSLTGRALDLAAASDGAFDPTVLPLMRAWGLRGGTPGVPTTAQLDSLALDVGWRLVETGPLGIRRLRAGVELDFGGIAKGDALDRAAAAMGAVGATSGVLDLGGNLLVFGPQETHAVAIVAPDHPQRRLALVQVRDAAVATSGQYERFIEIDGRRYGHILDPRTGRPVARRGSVTVVAETAWLADALATTLFVLGPTEGVRLLEHHPGASCVFVTEGSPGEWIVTRHRGP